MTEELPAGTPCASCGRPMIAQSQYRADSARWRKQGFVRQGAGQTCNGCYTRGLRSATPSKAKPRTPPLDPAVVAQLRAAAGLPTGGAS